MRSIVNKILAAWMVIVVFAVTTGFNLFSHICLMGGDHEISTTEIASCCSLQPKASDFQLNTKCCDDEIQFIKLDFTTIVTKFQAQSENLPLIAFYSDDLMDVVDEHQTNLIYNNLPPPKSGREILTTNHVFRI